jgi:hypothetical protein
MATFSGTKPERFIGSVSTAPWLVISGDSNMVRSGAEAQRRQTWLVI